MLPVFFDEMFDGKNASFFDEMFDGKKCCLIF
jgi:hypothetical protein